MADTTDTGSGTPAATDTTKTGKTSAASSPAASPTPNPLIALLTDYRGKLERAVTGEDPMDGAALLNDLDGIIDAVPAAA